ncbi:MAG: NAD(P)/FAD-dependent oxidoreductase [Proteobacteria bacterium]|nr:NAD(P)/FAD-dependent oxidoreductase [Pseudomonadota bacterium]
MSSNPKSVPAKARADAPRDYEVIVIGAGVAGIYQIKRLADLGVKATLLEAYSDLGGTWFNNRYPGARFDSESFTYGYSFSKELLDEWDWSEWYSPQPETLRYLNYVADKFDLRKFMQFNCRVASMHFNDDADTWTLTLTDGRKLTTRFVVTALGVLSIPTRPNFPGMETFKGLSFHPFDWPHDQPDLSGKRVAIIGTGATAIQIIPEVAKVASKLTVFQRRPNWAAPLNNAKIDKAEMAKIRARYDEIFAACARTPGGFEHEPDRRGFYEVTPAERRELWDKLYDGPGFGIWLQNFVEIFTDEKANAEFSAYIAERIRQRVKDPVLAEKLIPKDHGFGIQRVPLETGYFETYNRDNVELVDSAQTPIKTITPAGLDTSDRSFEFDVIIYSTGFDAFTGAFDQIDIRGAGGVKLRDKWAAGPSTFMGLMVSGMPNLVMLAGPQHASTNFPRGAELAVDWVTPFLEYLWKHGYTRFDAREEAEAAWVQHVKDMYQGLLMGKAKSWITGYNANLPGHEYGKTRYNIYAGGGPKYARTIARCAEQGYEGVDLS